MLTNQPLISETLGLFADLLILTLLGLGPALWFMKDQPRRVVYALSLAPSVGFAMVLLVAFPVVRFLGPIQNWAWIITLVLIAAGMAYIARNRLLRVELSDFARDWRQWAAPAGLMAVCMLALASPLILRGIQYTAFRSNPSDAYFYMSLAESVRAAPWRTLLAGAPLTSANLPAVAQLAAASPTAVFSARTLGFPVLVGNMTGLAWLATLVNTAIYRFYFAENVLALARSLPLLLVLGDLLKLPRPLNYLAAIGIAAGFWAHFLLETDASAEVNALSLVLLAVIAWAQFETLAPARLPRPVWLFTLAAAAIASIYPPILVNLALAVAAYYALAALGRTLTPPRSLVQWAAIAAGVFILVLPNIDFLAQNFVHEYLSVADQQAFPPIVIDLLRANGLGAVWGMPAALLRGRLPQLVGTALGALGNLLGLGLTAALAVTGLYSLRRTAPIAERVVLALTGSGLAVAAVMLAAHNPRSAGKAFTYIFPYLLLAALLIVHYMPPRLGRLAPLATLGLGVWLAGQVVFGSALPYRGSQNFVNQSGRPEQYGLGDITGYLDQHPPRQLLVAIPRGDSWTFAYYSMFVFSRYPAYFQTGLVIDNNTTYRNLWFSSLTSVPDYAVIAKSADYIGPQQLGTLVAQTNDLALYHITTTTLAPFQAAEANFRQQEAARPLFAGLSE
jgi:hypothetical protein